MKKDFFLFYSSWYKVVKDLPTEIKIEIYEATIEYGLYGTITELTPMANVAFGFIKDDIDRNTKTYEEIKKQRSEAGKKGSEARWGKTSKNNDGDQLQPIEDVNNPSQDIANNNTPSQSIANDSKIWQDMANDNNGWHNKNKNKNENKNNSLSLTLSQSDIPSETEKEREDFVFKNLFWLNRKKPKEETQRLIDNYQSQGWRKANGREITDLASVVRMWKCEEQDGRMPRKHLECLRKMLEAVNLHDNVNALRETDKLVSNGDRIELYCTHKLATYLQEHSQAIKSIYKTYFSNKQLFLKYLD